MPRLIQPNLKVVCSPGSQVMPAGEGAWRLAIPAGTGGKYRLAQLDDYTGTPRRQFPWRPPLTFSLRARASTEDLPGTWGFGLWNDPFSLSLGFGGGTRRFPALPNTTWFFHASPPNYLSMRDDLPAQGFLAATFRSTTLPAPLLAVLSPGVVLFTLPHAARLFRRLARRFIRQDAVLVGGNGEHTPAGWHAYQINWSQDSVIFSVDGATIFNTPVSPRGPLSLVIWIDNQYAALPPTGRLSFGALPNLQPAWIEISDLSLALP
jgi:hypothetical protein